MLKKTREIIRRCLSSEKPLITPKSSAFNTVALVFPHSYFVGMSNLGFQTVYKLLNERSDTLCERSFLFDTGEVFTLESRRSLRDFDIAAFSISFEADFPNVVQILKNSGIPLRSGARCQKDPLVIVGGVCSFINPEPISDFIDVFLIGEAEGFLDEFMDRYGGIKFRARDEVLYELSKIEGVYVPAVHREMVSGGLKIRKRWADDLNRSETRSAIISRDTEFGGKFLVEVSRGCPRGCRFCAARFVYKEMRIRDVDILKRTIDKGLIHSRDIGLVGASVSDYPRIGELCEFIMGKGGKISISSLRVDSAGEVLLKSLADSGQRTITVAPEAGTDRLRNVIKKGIREEEIMRVAGIAKRCGIRDLKMYYMYGLPTETEEDIKGLVNEAKAVAAVIPVKLNVSPFVPKPHTPFQWCAMDDRESLKEKMDLIKTGLKNERNIDIAGEGVKSSALEALLSRGDSSLGERLESGIKLSDPALMTAPFKKLPLDAALPWDFIDDSIEKEFLKKEYREALRQAQGKP